MTIEFPLLIMAAASFGLFHTRVGQDHYLRFIAIAHSLMRNHFIFLTYAGRGPGEDLWALYYNFGILRS